jgi:hypothetical protein
MDEPLATPPSAVDATAAAPSDPPAAPADLPDPYLRWATALFWVLAIFSLVVGLFVLGAPSIGPAAFAVVLLSLVLDIAVLLTLVAALGRRDTWAVHAIQPICQVLLTAGLIRLVVGLTQSNITVPLDAIGAAMVLSRPHGPGYRAAVSRPDRRRINLAVGALVAAQLLPFLAEPLRDGGLFGAQESSLDLRVALDCGGAGAAGGPVPIRVTWTWAGNELFSPPNDGLLVQWNMTTDGLADPSAAVAGEVSVSEPDDIWAGGGGSASALIQPLTLGLPSREFGIDLHRAGLRDGSVAFDLRPADSTARHGGVEAWASYAHGDRWLHQSDFATCAW